MNTHGNWAVSYTHLDVYKRQVLGGSRELLRPLYHKFHDWILEYDLERIDELFKAKKDVYKRQPMCWRVM